MKTVINVSFERIRVRLGEDKLHAVRIVIRMQSSSDYDGFCVIFHLNHFHVRVLGVKLGRDDIFYYPRGVDIKMDLTTQTYNLKAVPCASEPLPESLNEIAIFRKMDGVQEHFNRLR